MNEKVEPNPTERKQRTESHTFDDPIKNRDNLEAYTETLPANSSQDTTSVPLSYYSHVNEVKKNPFSLRAVDSFNDMNSYFLPLEKQHSLSANPQPPDSILASFPLPTTIDQTVAISLPAKWQYNDAERKIDLLGLLLVWFSIEGIESIWALFWLFFQFFWFALGWYLASDADKYTTAMLVFGLNSFRVSRGAALALNVNACLILLTMCRLSISWIQSTVFKSHVSLLSACRKLHIGLGIAIIFWTIVHATAHVANAAHAADMYQSSILWKTAFQSPAWITGIVMLILLAGISLSGLPIIRAKSYEVFYYTHVFIFLFLGLLAFHGAFCFIPVDRNWRCNIPTSYMYFIPPLVLNVTELVIGRYLASRPTDISKVILHPSQVLELQIVKPSLIGHFLAGQYVYLKVPCLSIFQWHPFTLTSAPQEPYVSLHIRLTGNWCKSLAALFGIGGSPSLNQISTASVRNKQFPVRNISVTPNESVQAVASVLPTKDRLSNVLLQVPPRIVSSGPYGSSAEAIFGYPIAVCIGAGIGQTPFASILKYILLSPTNSRTSDLPGQTPSRQLLEHFPIPPRKVFFIGIARLPQAFEWFHQILGDIEKNDVEERISIQLYLTGKLPDYQVSNILMHDREGHCDAITGLRTPTNYGRPKISALLQEIAMKARHYMQDSPLLKSNETDKKDLSNINDRDPRKPFPFSIFSRNSTSQENPLPIGVFYCGPPKLGRTIHTACAFLNHQCPQLPPHMPTAVDPLKPKRKSFTCRFHYHQETF